MPRAASAGENRRLLYTLLLASLLIASACSADDGGEVRNLDPSGSASGSGSESASGSGISDGECRPVGAELESEAETTVQVTLSDFAFSPNQIEVPAGIVTFEVTNDGSESHELAFLPGGGEVPFTDDGEPDEEALSEAGVFELEAFGPGQTCNATYDLEPGTYTLFCIVETGDGSTHYEHGMQGTLLVTG